MTGIQGLYLTGNAMENVKGLFDLAHWTHWTILKITRPTRSSIEVVDYDIMGIKWDGDAPETTWNQFTSSLPLDECRYALCHFDSIGSDGVERSKMILVLWCPEQASIRQRMQCTMHFYEIKRHIEAFGGIHLTIQANEKSDLNYKDILKRVRRLSYCF